MRNEDRFEDIVKKDLDVRASEEMYDRMRDIILSAHGLPGTTESAATQIPRRRIMRNPIARLAVAAAILAAIGLGLFAFISTGNHSGVVWAQVAERVNASKGFICRKRVIQSRAGWDQPMEFSAMAYESPRHGLRIEGIEGNTMDFYASYDDGVRVTLLRDTKQYTRHIEPPHSAGTEVESPAGAMPRIMVRQFTSGPYQKLGRRTIDGVEAEGIEVKNPPGFGGNFQVDSHIAQLWVDVEMGYPVLMESNVVGNNGTLQIKTIVDQFQWDVEFDPSDFKATIPPDYTETTWPQP
jgi:hypothetical protein